MFLQVLYSTNIQLFSTFFFTFWVLSTRFLIKFKIHQKMFCLYTYILFIYIYCLYQEKEHFKAPWKTTQKIWRKKFVDSGIVKIVKSSINISFSSYKRISKFSYWLFVWAEQGKWSYEINIQLWLQNNFGPIVKIDDKFVTDDDITLDDVTINNWINHDIFG